MSKQVNFVIQSPFLMKRILFVLMCMLGVLSTRAQDVYTSSGGHPGFHKKTKKKGYDPDKLIVGGGFSASFGNGNIDLGIAPVLGYRFTNNFSAGVGLGYQYYRFVTYQDQFNTYYENDNIVYPSLWARYTFYRNLFLTTDFEYDFIHIKGTYLDNLGYLDPENTSVTAPCWLVGFGFKQPLGGRVSGIMEIMYDVLQQPYSPYLRQPVMRLGIVAGL
jgi:hypothetical protein